MTKSLPKFTMQQLLDAGVHFGHKTMRWDPRMAPYIFGERNNIHIIDLQKTVPMLYQALEVTRDVAAANGRILFVATKRQAAPIVAEAAKRSGQYYVNHRWLGGMLTNWGTISKSIQTLRSLEAKLQDPDVVISKKERLNTERKITKLELALGGIKDMGGQPDLIFVIDTGKESIAIQEAQKLGIPVIGVVDTNTNPEGIDYMIPGNDDAIRSIQLYCDLISDAALKGIEASVGGSAKIETAKAEKEEGVKVATKKAPVAKAPEAAAEPEKKAASGA